MLIWLFHHVSIDYLNWIIIQNQNSSLVLIVSIMAILLIKFVRLTCLNIKFNLASFSPTDCDNHAEEDENNNDNSPV